MRATNGVQLCDRMCSAVWDDVTVVKEHAKPMPVSADQTKIQNALGLDHQAIARICAIGVPGRPVDLPDDARANALLSDFAALEEDRAECLAARPDPARHPELWWVLTVMVDELIQTMDVPIPIDGFHGWPALPASTGVVGRYLYAWAMLAVVPEVCAVHLRRGVPREVTIQTLSALGGVMQTHRQVTNLGGVGLFHLWGPPVSFRGTGYDLGRLHFTRAELSFGEGPAGYVLNVHVPPTGPLDADQAAASLARAAEFFPQCYPEEPVTMLSCTSWLLDPQLAEYLAASSNIVKFQKLFTPVAQVSFVDGDDGDRELMRMALDMLPPDGPITAEILDAIPQTTSLQRAYVQHLRAGRHWHQRSGWAPFAAKIAPADAQ
jgi:hypothetical protein